jgi:hypothetical protein
MARHTKKGADETWDDMKLYLSRLAELRNKRTHSLMAATEFCSCVRMNTNK